MKKEEIDFRNNLVKCHDELEHAIMYVNYSISRSMVGEDKNAKLLAEIAERDLLRAFLYIQNAMKGGSDDVLPG